MNRKIDWVGRNYTYGTTIVEHCRNTKDCDWRKTMSRQTGFAEQETCPVCGSETDCSITFGGLTVTYDRVKDNFTLFHPASPDLAAYIDCGDCPDTILFMINHYRFDGWAESVIRGE